jgi:predicted nucleotidyltransferase
MESIRDELSSRIAGFAEPRAEILAVYLFGSSLRKAHPHDIDIAVLLARPLRDERRYPFGYTAAITTELISLLHTDVVDVVILNNASPLLMMQVLKTGTLLYSRDERARLEYEKRMRDTYIDTAPLRRIKEYYLRKKLV